jgi:hypothetical protein
MKPEKIILDEGNKNQTNILNQSNLKTCNLWNSRSGSIQEIYYDQFKNINFKNLSKQNKLVIKRIWIKFNRKNKSNKDGIVK